MARPGLTRHRKFAHLSRLIGSPAIARGSLELLWDVGYENGDDLLGTADDVEYLASWNGEKGILADALQSSGFIDKIDGQYRIHDLLDHAPDYVRRRLIRERQRRENGDKLRSVTGQCPVSDRSVATISGVPSVATPAPAPAPAPAPKDQNHSPKKLRKRIAYPDDFKTFWDAYPRPVYKAAAYTAWKSALLIEGATPEKITRAVLEYADQCEKDGRAEKYIMQPETFLHKERWQEYCFKEEV